MRKLSLREIPNHFWSKVDKKSNHECWLWLGASKRGGYGTIKSHGKNFGAHRLAWKFSNGEIPKGLMVLHHCDNPPCCNPTHLFVGTARDNILDSLAKGRSAGVKANIGVENHNTRLNPQKVLEIRKLLEVGVMSMREIGRIYGVQHGTIRKIRDRVTWSYL